MRSARGVKDLGDHATITGLEVVLNFDSYASANASFDATVHEYQD